MPAPFAILPLLTTLLAPAALAGGAPELGPRATPEEIEAINRVWRGVGIGYENGLWGSDFAQGISLQVPFGAKLGQFVGARARVQMSHASDELGEWSPLYRGGLELFGRGPVLLGILRVYGGGGVYMGIPADNAPDPVITGGGHYGVEFACAKKVSFSFEVGGQGPTHEGAGAGASVMAGSTVYFGKQKKSR